MQIPKPYVKLNPNKKLIKKGKKSKKVNGKRR